VLPVGCLFELLNQGDLVCNTLVGHEALSGEEPKVEAGKHGYPSRHHRSLNRHLTMTVENNGVIERLSTDIKHDTAKVFIYLFYFFRGCPIIGG